MVLSLHEGITIYGHRALTIIAYSNMLPEPYTPVRLQNDAASVLGGNMHAKQTPPYSGRCSFADTALAVLLVLQVSMMFAMFSRTEPHPPLFVAPFGMGPFLASSIALCVAALMLGAQRSSAGRIVSWVAIAIALVAFGPHKWFDPAVAKIWPALLLGQAAIVGLGWSCWRALKLG